MNQGLTSAQVMFFIVWVPLGIANACFFLGSKNAKLKRFVFPWVVIGAGLLFTGFIAVVAWRWEVLALMVPAVLLISYLNIRNTKFCDSCGATLFNHSWFRKMSYCSRCGASLEIAPNAEHRV
jgi:hypothetical protein